MILFHTLMYRGAWEEGACQGDRCAQVRSGFEPKFRTRQCDNPPPANGGNLCEGESILWANCPTKTCGAKSSTFTSNFLGAQTTEDMVTVPQSQPEGSSTSSSSSDVGLIVGVVLGALALLALLAAVAFCCYRRYGFAFKKCDCSAFFDYC